MHRMRKTTFIDPSRITAVARFVIAAALLQVACFSIAAGKAPKAKGFLLYVSDLKLAPGNVVGGSSVTGTVTLNGAAPSGGATVSLTSNNSGATVASSVTVP